MIWWLRVRGQHPIRNSPNRSDVLFIGGDLRRFLSPGFYVVKPAFIRCDGVCGCRAAAGGGGNAAARGSRVGAVAGILFYFLLIPTCADQTHYCSR